MSISASGIFLYKQASSSQPPVPSWWTQPKLPATHMRSLLKKNAKNIIIYWKVANFPYSIILHPLLSILHETYTYLPVMITKYPFKDVHAKSLEHGLQLWGLRSFIVFVLGLEPRGSADHIRSLSLICTPNPPPRRMKKCESGRTRGWSEYSFERKTWGKE